MTLSSKETSIINLLSPYRFTHIHIVAITLLPILNTVWPREMQVRLPTKYQVRQAFAQEFYVVMVDDNGYIFNNFSSLIFDWQVSDDVRTPPYTRSLC
jgi:hypothetical protein